MKHADKRPIDLKKPFKVTSPDFRPRPMRFGNIEDAMEHIQLLAMNRRTYLFTRDFEDRQEILGYRFFKDSKKRKINEINK